MDAKDTKAGPTNAVQEGEHDFSFPVLGAPPAPSSSASSSSLGEKAPLTARSTVRTAGAPASEAKPISIAQGEEQKQSKPKKVSDPEYLTRALYGFLSKFIPTYTRVPLEKGYSQVDWLRVTRTDRNLNGLNGGPIRKDITMDEVRQHKTKDDAWMVFRNKVYNISPYLKFHPGGVDVLMKAAGKDGTSLFMKYHPWVNADALMEGCLIGYLEERPLL